ncbi:MAG TPA: hypothetical protein EYM49_04780 [Campylobacterales bacterium]|nr:hypothetical protein [Campylobacterales bacterium]
MENIDKKYIKIVLYISLITTITGAILATIFFKIPMAISIFFGAILGFFAPWVVALLGYTFYAMSNPTLAFKDEIKKTKK